MATIPIPIRIPHKEKEEISTPEKFESDVFGDEMELSAPHGWKKKKFTPTKGGTLRRNEIFFISPTGEEIRNKRQLEQYLKSHPGGPSSTEFDWGTGDTPRRSARINDKVKATETPEGEQAKKRGKKSSDSKEEDEEKEGDKETEAPEDTEAAAAAKEPKDVVDAEMKPADDGGQEVEDVATKEVGEKEASVEQKDQEEVDNNDENPQIREINSDAKETEHKKLAEQKEKAKEGQPAESVVPPPTSEFVNGEAKSLKETEGEEGLPEEDIDNDMEPRSAEAQSSINGVDGLHPPPVSC
ncbi:methyl-CpG-binding domain-containing protein 11-like protein [Cinnamomum micranthum f. kanehirae]|uniref:Methyl-CpG-binding domain-containing protein 11-like protein n=1 Tax=Cinnamomum micranthum f. kanehirae TaxID=337451 RepID=A0A3S3N4X8_9MAGN|nr:methyl-CpG-binding domain-containing protein 11-like protein [Cinnamomum micranthum f. kanehirae]